MKHQPNVTIHRHWQPSPSIGTSVPNVDKAVALTPLVPLSFRMLCALAGWATVKATLREFGIGFRRYRSMTTTTKRMVLPAILLLAAMAAAQTNQSVPAGTALMVKLNTTL